MSGWVRIPITGGATLIDPLDIDLFAQRRWHVNDSGYAVWRGLLDGSKVTLRLHRLIAKTPNELVTDHVNHDRLDNRRSNLRAVTQRENMLNLSNPGKGYWFHNQNRNWCVELSGKHIGSFSTEAEAAQVVAMVRAGGTYEKPVRTHCSFGHSLEDAYRYGRSVQCKPCTLERQRLYSQRRKKRT